VIAAVVDEVYETAGGRLDLLSEEVGQWIGFYEADPWTSTLVHGSACASSRCSWTTRSHSAVDAARPRGTERRASPAGEHGRTRSLTSSCSPVEWGPTPWAWPFRSMRTGYATGSGKAPCSALRTARTPGRERGPGIPGFSAAQRSIHGLSGPLGAAVVEAAWAVPPGAERKMCADFSGRPFAWLARKVGGCLR
jgi:hypothetical protein